jgi:tetratricopeptide (TPR) repeat protein
VTEPALTEKDFATVAERLLAKDRAGAVAAATALLVGAATGHPVLGVLAGKGAGALATAVVDRATARFLEAGHRLEGERERLLALQRSLLDVLGPNLDVLQNQDDERFLQLVRYLDRNVASARAQARMYEGQSELVQEVRELRCAILERRDVLDGDAQSIPFEGPGRAPAPPVRLFSAEEELEQLRRLLASDRPSVCIVVEGMGGIGKTTLARELVARHGRALFPDGVGWLDAGELDVDLPRVCSRFGLGGRPTLTIEEARQWLCETLCARHALLIVDNVAPDSTQLRHLPFPGGQCRTLLASRDTTLHLMLGEASEGLNLGQWHLERCRAYLRATHRAFGDASDADLDALGTFVGGLPLALHLLAVHPAMRRGTSTQSLLKELQATPIETLDRFVSNAAPSLAVGVVKTFQAAWLALSSTEQNVLRTLCVCARRTRTDVVSATAGLGKSEAEQSLNDLVNISLAHYCDNSDAPWTVHSVVRLFVCAKGAPIQLEAAHQRWVARHMADHAAPDDYIAFERGVAEAVVVVERLLQQAKVSEAARVFFPLYRHLCRRGEYGQAVALCQAVLNRAPSESALEARWLTRLGSCYEAVGHIPKAVELFERSLAVDESLGNLVGQRANLGGLGICQRILGRIPKAIELHERALAINEKLGSLDGEALLLGNLGICYQALGDISRAVELHEHSLAINERLRRLDGQAMQLGNLGVCLKTLGDIAQAIKFFSNALAINEKIGRLEGQMQALASLGGCYESLGNVPKAIELLERALGIGEKIGNLEGQATILADLGMCHRSLRDVPKAMELLARSFSIENRIGRLAGHAVVLGNLGICFSLMGDVPKAIELSERALHINERLGRLGGQATQSANLGIFYKKLGDVPSAKSHLSRGLELFARMGLPEKHPDVRGFRRILETLG